MEFVVGDITRFAFGFANPNHAAAAIAAVMPLLWGGTGERGRDCERMGDCERASRPFYWMGVCAALVVMMAMTQSRTGFVVLAMEAGAWWMLRRRRSRGDAPRLRRSQGDGGTTMRRVLSHGAVALALLAVAVWWMWPRMSLDGSILNRPKIWLAGLRLFAANPDGVGLGNSGAVASAFLLDGIPEVRTMINAHITLLAEFGWIVGWAWLAFIGVALCGFRTSPRVGIAFVGLAVSGCSSTVFDWAVLFDFAEQGGLGRTNWMLSWATFVLFVGLGVWLVVGVGRRTRSVRPTVAVVLAGMAVLGSRLLPAGNAPQVRDGYVICGETPRTLALYDETWKLKTVAMRVKGGAVLPVRGMMRFPREMDWSGIDKVMLFGDCREWKHLVKGMTVECVEE